MSAAQLKPPPARESYVGYKLVSAGAFEEWVAMNVEILFHNFLLESHPDLEQLAAFSAREWEKERDRAEDYRGIHASFAEFT